MAKGLMSGLDLKSLGISLSFFGLYQRLHWEMKLKKGRKKADEQGLCFLIMFWDLVAAMSAKYYFADINEAVNIHLCPSQAVLTGDIIVPKLLIVCLPPSTVLQTKIIMRPLLIHLGVLKPEPWVDWIHWPCWQQVEKGRVPWFSYLENRDGDSSQQRVGNKEVGMRQHTQPARLMCKNGKSFF